MSIPAPPVDRTGERIVPREGLVDVDVLARNVETGIYLIQDVLKTDPTMRASPYFISTEGLEAMIIFFEAGVWPGGI